MEQGSVGHDQHYTAKYSQDGKLLPFLDHEIKGYIANEFYQWEVCAQHFTCSPSPKTLTNKISNKVKHV
eukprot:8500937-Ditylum_brightwellii.AAC.1